MYKFIDYKFVEDVSTGSMMQFHTEINEYHVRIWISGSSGIDAGKPFHSFMNGNARVNVDIKRDGKFLHIAEMEHIACECDKLNHNEIMTYVHDHGDDNCEYFERISEVNLLNLLNYLDKISTKGISRIVEKKSIARDCSKIPCCKCGMVDTYNGENKLGQVVCYIHFE